MEAVYQMSYSPVDVWKLIRMSRERKRLFDGSYACGVLGQMSYSPVVITRVVIKSGAPGRI